MIHYVLNELTGGKSVGIQNQIWSRDTEAKLHTHDFLEIIIVTRGCGLNQVDTENFPVMVGDIQLIRPGATHTFHTLTELHITNLMFAPRALTPTVKELFRQLPAFHRWFGETSETPTEVIHFPLSEFQRFQEELRAFREELLIAAPGAESELVSLARLILLLIAICRVCRTPPKPSHSSNRRNHELLSLILDEVNANFRLHLPTKEVARKAGISPNYLSEFFRAQTGIPFVHYLNQMRICYARTLLANHPEWNVTEIAGRCGFTDSSYFARVYRKLTGESPLTIRKSRQMKTIIRKKS